MWVKNQNGKILESTRTLEEVLLKTNSATENQVELTLITFLTILYILLHGTSLENKFLSRYKYENIKCVNTKFCARQKQTNYVFSVIWIWMFQILESESKI